MVWLILIVRLVVVGAVPMLTLALRRRRSGSSGYHGMNLAHRRRIAQAEGEAV